MAAPPEYLVVGHLNKAHGTKGEVYIWPLTDSPEDTFVPGRSFRLGGGATGTELRPRPPVEVAEVRSYRRGYLVRFEGVTDRTTAEGLLGHYLLRPFAELAERAEGEIFYHEFLGLEVVTVEGDPVGAVTEVFPLEPEEMMQVTEGSRVRLIPFSDRIVQEVDLEARRIVIDPPEGLLDL